jgi:predicted dehydrogenase
MERTLGLGVIGCGSVLKAYLPVIENLDYHKKARLIMACDQRSELEAAVLAETGAQAFTTDFRRLLESPQVDIVLVLTSMQSHAALARAALEAGKHVLVEKPFATNLEQAAGLVQLARQSPGHLLAAPHVLLSPTFQAIAGHIRRGDIGRPLTARARYGWAGPWWSQWFYQPGGGALFDLAPYNVTSLTGLLGPAKRVTALAGTAIAERVIDGHPVAVQAEDNAQVLIDFGEAVFAVVTTGFTIQQYRSPALEIYGSRGAVQMLGDDWDPDGYELWQNETGAWKVYKETEPNWSWCDGLNHLVECIHSEKKPIITPEHAYHVLEILVKAKEASRDGTARTLNSSFSMPDLGEFSADPQVHLIHDRTHRL